VIVTAFPCLGLMPKEKSLLRASSQNVLLAVAVRFSRVVLSAEL
jgi:hypothetical protein